MKFRFNGTALMSENKQAFGVYMPVVRTGAAALVIRVGIEAADSISAAAFRICCQYKSAAAFWMSFAGGLPQWGQMILMAR